jgi:hypothetical protein
VAWPRARRVRRGAVGGGGDRSAERAPGDRAGTVAARLDAGEAALLVPELEALVAEEPLREERWRLLVLALYRAHRQADALGALRRARALLAEDLGIDPGPALRALEAEVLASRRPSAQRSPGRCRSRGSSAPRRQGRSCRRPRPVRTSWIARARSTRSGALWPTLRAAPRSSRLLAAVAPWTTGSQYLPMLDDVSDSRKAHPPEVFARLSALRRTVDPTGLFVGQHA